VKVGVDFEAQDGMTWEAWTRLARLVEDRGFESLWRSDHLFSVVGRTERPALEAMTALTQLATVTTRLRFGTLVTPITFRHPAVFGLQAAAIDALSGGRLEIGLGAGWHTHEHDAFGIPFASSMGERLDILEEGIQVLKALWTQEEAHYSGEHFSLAGARCHPRPAQRPHPPIVIGGAGEKRTLRIVAEHADEWNVHGITLDGFRDKRAVLERHCEAVGRDPGSIRHSVAGPCVIGATDADVRRGIDALAEFFPMVAPAFFPQGDATDNSVEAVRARGWFAGRPEEIVEQIRSFANEGVDRVIMQHMPHDEGSLELFAATVLPEV
jgi:F420-dependent oxidoreductase-like protein